LSDEVERLSIQRDRLVADFEARMADTHQELPRLREQVARQTEALERLRKQEEAGTRKRRELEEQLQVLSSLPALPAAGNAPIERKLADAVAEADRLRKEAEALRQQRDQLLSAAEADSAIQELRADMVRRYDELLTQLQALEAESPRGPESGGEGRS